VSLTAGAIRLLAAKGLSIEDIAEVAEANAAAREVQTAADRKRIRDRERMRLYRATDWTKLRQRVFERDAYHCVYCGVEIHGEPHCDHVTPLSKGGTNDIDNLVTACPPCNLSKSNIMPGEWIKR